MIFATGFLVAQQSFGKRYSIFVDEPRIWFGHHLKRLPPAMVLFVVLVYGTRHAVYALLGPTYWHESWAFVFPYESIKLGLFAGLWLGVIFSFESYAHVQEQQRRVLIMQRTLSEARLSQRVHTYVIPTDAGSAPNYEGPFVTLAVCKPRIRKKAKIGELVLAFAGKSVNPIEPHSVVWAGIVSEKLSFSDYWNDRRFSRKKPGKSEHPDNFYRPVDGGLQWGTEHRSRT